jgi:hypothetical protein
MACLKDASYELATGDLIECKNCKGILNMFSLVEEQEGKHIWNCEFCTHKNELEHFDLEEKPKTATVSYIIEAAPLPKTKEEEKTKQLGPDGLAKDISIVYCIDVSGSMAGSRLTAVQKTIIG